MNTILNRIFNVEDIDSKGSITLSEKEFDDFVSKYNLPVFKHKYVTKHHRKTWNNEVYFTIFHGTEINIETKRKIISSEELVDRNIQLNLSPIL